jgi:hypothetical protein
VGLPCSEGERARSLTTPPRGAEGDSLEWRLFLRRNACRAFYTRFNQGKGPFQLPGGASQGATRLFGAALIAIGIMGLIGAFD